MTRWRFRPELVLASAALLLSVGCSGGEENDDGASVGVGGQSGAGGGPPAGTGGAPATGGLATGGATPNAGGTPTTGGTAIGGASPSTGGTPSAGGTATGGAIPSTGGTVSGGAATGGTGPTGGTAPTGGAESTGGTAPTGGTESTGGTAPTGGNAGDCAIPAPSPTPIGYGASVTGGGDKTPVEVSSQAELEAALAAYEDGTDGLVIRYTGTFDFSAIAADPCQQFGKEEQTVDIKDMQNLTLIGAPGSAINFGLHLVRVSNVIIRNMTIGYVPGAGDAIGIEGASSRIWIDHNELFSSMVECDGAGDSEFDGLLDIKDESHHMTFSFNYFHDHHKVGLMGSSDDDAFDWYVTLHHNWYDTVGSRLPLQRGGLTHIFNNYYRDVTVSGINSRVDAVALIEKNYFENCRNPVTSRGSDVIGYWDLRDNFHVGDSWSGESPDVNAEGWATTRDFPEDLGYSYSADPKECVKSIVMATAGATLSL